MTTLTENGKELIKKYYDGSIYILSDEDFTEEEATDELNYEELENAYFVEFDKSVASFYNYENCAIFHVEEDEEV
ncbi:MAG: hypothetical protein PVF17_00935 [Ignavibacteria bacterium]